MHAFNQSKQNEKKNEESYNKEMHFSNSFQIPLHRYVKKSFHKSPL